MRPIPLLSFFILILSICSCRADFETTASSGKLQFSRDTIYLDTVFTDISSSTYNLKVYNRSKNDINIPIIQFQKGLNSKYRMTVDGMSGTEGKIFNNVTLLAKDSLYIFIETTANIADANPTDFLYTDEIQFDNGSNLQEIHLVTLIQDAHFIFPKRFEDGTTETQAIGTEKIEGFYLDENDPINGDELHFTNQKPYVIYGYAAVPEGKTLIMDAGSRVYFHANSGLVVPENASLNINGDVSTTAQMENEVFFEGDRLEPDFSEVPGQWGTIYFLNGSTNNTINHLTIKNATIGLLFKGNDNTTVNIKNTQIYNSANYGILAENAKINGENIVVNTAGEVGLGCFYGGDYTFTHCTFNNYWNSSTQLSVSISNFKTGATPETKDLTAAKFNNCIIYGSNFNAFALNKKTGATFEYQFDNCLFKYNGSTTDPDYQFTTDTNHYNGIILNKNPKFENIAQNKLNIDGTSPAFAKGNPDYLIPLDVVGITRTLPPDLGAYQSKPFTP